MERQCAPDARDIKRRIHIGHALLQPNGPQPVIVPEKAGACIRKNDLHPGKAGLFPGTASAIRFSSLPRRKNPATLLASLI